MKKLLCVLAFCMILITSAIAEPWDEVIGQTIPDFEATCADGSIFRLSDALADKKLAVICVFGSGCGACRKELRALEMAYRLYSEHVAVIGLSLDMTYDTEEVLLAFAGEMGLTFPLARDPMRTARFMKINMYPAFMIVDHAGTVQYIEVNGTASIDHFVELFDEYLGNVVPEIDAVCEGESCPLPEDE